MQRVNSTTEGIFRGVVAYWRGTYGFIQPDEGGEQVFVHHTAIDSQMEFRQLNVGQKVEFEKAHGEKGPIAAHVRICGPEAK